MIQWPTSPPEYTKEEYIHLKGAQCHPVSHGDKKEGAKGAAQQWKPRPIGKGEWNSSISTLVSANVDAEKSQRIGRLKNAYRAPKNLSQVIATKKSGLGNRQERITPQRKSTNGVPHRESLKHTHGHLPMPSTPVLYHALVSHSRGPLSPPISPKLDQQLRSSAYTPVYSGNERRRNSADPPKPQAVGYWLRKRRTYKPPTALECSFSGDLFARDHDLEAHQRTHTVQRSFVCSICNTAFNSKQNLQIHESSKTHREMSEHAASVLSFPSEVPSGSFTRSAATGGSISPKRPSKQSMSECNDGDTDDSLAELLICQSKDLFNGGKETEAVDHLERALLLTSERTPRSIIEEIRNLLHLISLEQQKLHDTKYDLIKLYIGDPNMISDDLDPISAAHLQISQLCLVQQDFVKARRNSSMAIKQRMSLYGKHSLQCFEAIQLQTLNVFAEGSQMGAEDLLKLLPRIWHQKTRCAIQGWQELHPHLSFAALKISDTKEEIASVGESDTSSWGYEQVSRPLSRISYKDTNLTKATTLSQNDGMVSSVCDDTPSSKDPVSTIPSCSLKHTSESEGEISFIGEHNIQMENTATVDEMDESAWQFIKEFAKRMVHRCLVEEGSGPSRSSETSQAGSSASTSPSNTKVTELTSSSLLKRNRTRPNDEEGEEDEDDQDSDPNRNKMEEGSAAKTVRIFACPYAKFDRERYSEQNQEEKRYRNCASSYLTSITRVKQHLYRTHQRPDWYCPICYTDFETRETSNIHIRQRACEPEAAKYEEMMTDKQYQEIKRRAAGNDARESWYRIFATLFPGATKPISPYVSTCDQAAVLHFVRFFQWFGPEEYYNCLRDRSEGTESSTPLEPSTKAIVDEALEIALPEYLTSRIRNPPTRAQRNKTSRPRKRVKNECSGFNVDDSKARDSATYSLVTVAPSGSDLASPPVIVPDIEILGEDNASPTFMDVSPPVTGGQDIRDRMTLTNQCEMVIDHASIDDAFESLGFLVGDEEAGLGGLSEGFETLQDYQIGGTVDGPGMSTFTG